MVTNRNSRPSNFTSTEGLPNSSVLTDLKAATLLKLENEIIEALRSPHPRLELAQIARWNGVNLEVIEDIAKAVSKQLFGKDLERLEFESVVNLVQKLELEEPDAGYREWKIQALARRVRRTPKQLLEAYNKALCQQKPVKPMTVREFREKQNQEVTWLVQGWIPRGSVVLLHADGGVGKTLFVYQMLESILSGKPWNGYQVDKGSALLVQVDEPELVTAERIDIRGISDDAPLGILSEWQVEQMPNLENTIAEMKPSVVVIDSLTAINRHCIFSENDTEYARPILQIAAIASKHNCTVIVIHHSNAEGNSRGTRAIYNSVSEVWGLSLAENGDRLLRVQKTRLGRPPGRYKFRFEEDDLSFHYLGMDGDADSELSATQEERIRLWLREQQGKRFTTTEMAEYLNMSKHTIRKACYELWAKGLIRRVRPRGERTYLYYIGSIDPTSKCDRSDLVISSDPSQVIQSNASEGIPLDGMRSCDLQKSKNSTCENFKNERSLDHIPLNPSPDLEQTVITSDDHLAEKTASVITSVTPTGTDPVLQAGDIVIANANATWHRSGSDKLPWREVAPSFKQADQIPLDRMSQSLFEEMIAPSRVIYVLRGGDRVKVRNQTTGRTSVFAKNDVQVLRRADSNADG